MKSSKLTYVQLKRVHQATQTGCSLKDLARARRMNYYSLHKQLNAWRKLYGIQSTHYNHHAGVVNNPKFNLANM